MIQRIKKVFKTLNPLQVFHVENSPFLSCIHYNFKWHNAAEIGFKEFQVLSYSALLRHIVYNKGDGMQFHDSVHRNHGQQNRRCVNKPAMPVDKQIQPLYECAENFEVEVPQMLGLGSRQPGKNARDHDQAHHKQYHDIDSRYNTKLTKNGNTGGKQG